MCLRRLAAAAALALLAAVPAYASPRVHDASLSVTRVVSGIEVPVSLAFIGENDFLVLEKNSGRVLRVTDAVVDPTPVLDLPVNNLDERGLLGIAVHPAFGSLMGKDWVYLYYSASGGDSDEGDPGATVNRLERFDWNGSALVNPLLLRSFPSPFWEHNGGALAFGPDGKLYGSNGDGGLEGRPQNNAPGAPFDGTSVIFRLNEDGSIPADNPFSASPPDGQEDIYFAYGIRNSFGLAFDPFDPFSLWETEPGTSIYDEINRIVRGANSGWAKIIGPGLPAAGSLVELPGSTYVEPDYSIVDVVTPTGAAFASASSVLDAAHVGNLFVGDYRHGNVYEFVLNASRTGFDTSDTVADNQSQLDRWKVVSGFDRGVGSIVEGPDGYLYVAAIGLGEIWRIGGGLPANDLAVAKVKSPKKITLGDTKPSVVKDVKVTLVNEGSATQTIADEAALLSLVSLAWTSLPGPSPLCPAPATLLEPPKKGFPVELASKKKLSVSYAVTWDCANDPAQSTKEESHADFDLTVTVSLAGDADPTNDVCPRPATGDDKGCGGKDANGDIGGPIETDVVVK